MIDIIFGLLVFILSVMVCVLSYQVRWAVREIVKLFRRVADLEAGK